MSDKPVYFDDKNKQVWEAVDEYFAHAGSNSDENMRLIQPVIDRFGVVILLVGISWVIERIQKEGSAAATFAIMGTPGPLINYRIFAAAETCVSQLKDIFRTTKDQAGIHLAASLSTPYDEDEQALSAYLFVDFISTLAPLQFETAKSLLKSHYGLADNTSCKMTLAWALYSMGEKKPWEDLVYGGVFVKSEFVSGLEQIAKTSNPSWGMKEIRNVICSSVATGEYTKLVPFPIVTELYKMNLLRYFALDIASNGQAFSSYPRWIRKAKKN